MTEAKINLANYNIEDLATFLVSINEKPFRATQIIKWIHQLGITDVMQMTNLSLKLRNYLCEHVEIVFPKIVDEKKSKDGTRKWLFQLEDGHLIETVYIPEEDRGTLCVSSQVGCSLNCAFCATATLGYKRNLTVVEIIGQLWVAIKCLSPGQFCKQRAITNVVMMGMGEPLLNFNNVVKSMSLMMEDNAYCLSKYRVTLSTSGVVPEMWRLREASSAALAVSLHAANDKLRDQLMPINKKYNLKELMAVCREYFKNEPRRSITFEYVMLDGVNDSQSDALQLIKLLQGIRCKINLIPFNPFSASKYCCSSIEKINIFRNILSKAGFNTVTRKTRGQDIAGACGQLVAGSSI